MLDGPGNVSPKRITHAALADPTSGISAVLESPNFVAACALSLRFFGFSPLSFVGERSVVLSAVPGGTCIPHKEDGRNVPSNGSNRRGA